MTPEERRARVEYVVKMAEQGFIAEPPEDREEWRAQKARGELPALDTPDVCSDDLDGATQESRRTA